MGASPQAVLSLVNQSSAQLLLGKKLNLDFYKAYGYSLPQTGPAVYHNQGIINSVSSVSNHCATAVNIWSIPFNRTRINNPDCCVIYAGYIYLELAIASLV